MADATATETLAEGARPHDPGEWSANVRDVLRNKSPTRKVIDVELLLLSVLAWQWWGLWLAPLVWLAVLVAEPAYHRWRLSRGEETQYCYPGGLGSGPLTLAATWLFYLQLLALPFLLLYWALF